MAYTPTVWQDGVTDVNATNLNHLETGVSDAHGSIASLDTRLIAEEGQPDVPAVVNGKWIKGVGGAMVWSDITTTDVGGLSAALAGKIDTSQKAAASGVASLDSTSRVVQQATVDKIYASGVPEGHHVVARSGVSVFEANAGAGADLSFDGDWAAGTYQDGDVVVSNGIAYLCVGGPTTVAPDITPWGGAVANRPAGELAYAQITALVTTTATTEATATTVVTAPPVVCDGATPLILTFYTPLADGGNNAGPVFCLYEDGVSLGFIGQGGATTAGILFQPLTLTRRITPSAGTHTYSIRFYGLAAGTRSCYAGTGVAGAYAPAFIRIQQANPVFIAPAGPTVTTYGLALPSSPADGQEHILVDSLTAATYQWRFRFNAARATNKWEFIGGPALSAEVAGGENSGATTYAALATPQIVTPPVTGLYRVEQVISFANATAGSGCFFSYDIGATGAVDADALVHVAPTAGSGAPIGATRIRTKTLTGGQALTTKVKVTAGTGTFTFRWLAITPIAVGG